MAVYTHLSDEEVEAFVAAYDIGAVVSCKGIAEGVENSNFLLVTNQGPFILTLYEKRVDPADLPFFLGLMAHLHARGINCPLPVEDREGKALGQLGGRPAVIITFLKGLSRRRILPAHAREVGRALAQMHLAADDFTVARPNALGLEGVRRIYDGCAARLDEIAPGLATELGQAFERFAGAGFGQLPRGVIHADLFPDNVFFTGEELTGLIDFYFACNDTLALDIAICLNAWCFEGDGSFNTTSARALLAGYQAVRPLEQGEIAALPDLSGFAALRFLMTRAHDWLHVPEGALVRPKDPLEYLKKLRFHLGVTSPAAYGIE